MRDRAATRGMVLGLLALPFGLLAPFAIWTSTRSLLRIRASDGSLQGSASAALGLVGGVVGATFLVGGVLFWVAGS